jgi:hypothetical protein
MPQWPPGPKPNYSAQAGGLWSDHASRGTASAHLERVASAHRHAVTIVGWQTWRDSQRSSEGLSVMRSSTRPPSWLRLQAATQGPRRGSQNRGPHWRGGRGGDNRWCRRQKRLPN